jgi:hypothetical protein
LSAVALVKAEGPGEGRGHLHGLLFIFTVQGHRTRLLCKNATI